MESLGEALKKLGLATTSEQLTPREYQQLQVDGMNDIEGHEHERDGYHCSICKNRGYVFKLEETEDGKFRQYATDCKCAEVRRSILRMKRSGLKDIIKEYTFDKFETPEAWQKALKDAAMAYAKHPKGWFYIGGQSGAGKSMLCTAICRQLLLEGRRTIYMRWMDDSTELKGLATEAEQRMELMNKFKKAEVLYIDDLFKPAVDQQGMKQRPTAADIRTAFEIINYRYNNPALITIISSEWSQDELLDIDEATGGRIFERAGDNGFSIAPDRRRNYRTRRAVTL